MAKRWNNSDYLGFLIDNLYGQLHPMKQVLYEMLKSQVCLFFCNWIFTAGLEKTTFTGHHTDNRVLCSLMISQKVNGLICCFVLKENLNSPHGKRSFHYRSLYLILNPVSCLKLIFKTCITSKPGGEKQLAKHSAQIPIFLPKLPPRFIPSYQRNSVHFKNKWNVKFDELGLV